MTKFYGWYVDIWDSGYDKWDYPVYKYVIRIGKYFLKIRNVTPVLDYPYLTEKECEAKIFIEPSEVLEALTKLVKNQNYIGWIQNCPRCQEKVQTTCSVCGCGSCCVCDYRFSCAPVDFSKEYDVKFQQIPLEVRLPQVNGAGEGIEGIA